MSAQYTVQNSFDAVTSEVTRIVKKDGVVVATFPYGSTYDTAVAYCAFVAGMAQTRNAHLDGPVSLYDLDEKKFLVGSLEQLTA